ncbi:MAG: cobyrinate a,c-diamide synthase [Desulfovibrionaceae bacterium]
MHDKPSTPADHPARQADSTPRMLLAGLCGGAGKTIVSLALVRALAEAGHRVKPFKKGPDYIDANWLSLAARAPATNLDPCFLGRERLRALYAEKTACGPGGKPFDLAIIEGNRGLFDGKDVHGSCSTAELARQLEAPVVLIIDCTKMTRTVAAVVAGCAAFEQGVNLAGVVLNRTAGKRHRAILRSAIETYTDAKVLGVLPKIARNPVPERHMGLVSDQEYDQQADALEELGRIGREHLDLEGLLATARSAPELGVAELDLWPPDQLLGKNQDDQDRPVIGYVHDAALWFYYPENLEALERAGARLVRLSLLDSAPWPEIHGLYLGGGFPETLAARLEANKGIREHVRSLAASGLPIYAECGGFMYLCRELEYEGRKHAMAGVFDLATGFCPRPQGLGYTEASVVRANPFYPVGARILGHEFHYSHCVAPGSAQVDLCLQMERGAGMLQGMDGVVQGSVMASYNHIFALAVPEWAPGFVRSALAYRAGR